MNDLFQKKNRWAIILVIAAIGVAIFSGYRTFGARTKLLPIGQQLAAEKEDHDKIQQELQQKYGIKPVPYGLPPSAGGAPTGATSGGVQGQVPTGQ